MLQNKFTLKTRKNSEIMWIYYFLLNPKYMKNVTCVEVPILKKTLTVHPAHRFHHLTNIWILKYKLNNKTPTQRG